MSSKQSPGGGEGTLGRGACTTSATSSPDHSDHALSVSSDSGLSSTSLWADKPAPAVTPATTAGTVKHGQGPSQQEKVELKRLLSGFGLEGPPVGDMDDRGPRVGVQQIVPAQVHVNGDPRPRERETDILDDEITAGHDLRSVDSLGTLSSSCHKSSQNSLLSDGFGSPGGEEHQGQGQHYPAPPAMEEYERVYAEARRGCPTSRSNSVASANPSSGSTAKQHVYRQESYSTQSWVRQQQMVAAQQFIYIPENGNEAEVFPGNKQDGGLPKAGQPGEPTGTATDTAKDVRRNKDQAAQLNNNNNNKCDEEFKSLTMDIDNSIDQLNQLIMDLDPTFVPLSGLSSSIKRNGVSGPAPKCTNGVNLRLEDKCTESSKTTQETGKLARWRRRWCRLVSKHDMCDSCERTEGFSHIRATKTATLATLKLFSSGFPPAPCYLRDSGLNKARLFFCLSHLVCFRSTNGRVPASLSDVFSTFRRKAHRPDLPAPDSEDQSGTRREGVLLSSTALSRRFKKSYFKFPPRDQPIIIQGLKYF